MSEQMETVQSGEETVGRGKVAVRYFSRSGNTKKLAEAVAAAAGTEAQDVSQNLTEQTDVVFLGSSLYAGGFDASIESFIQTNADKIGKIVVFGSSASGKSTATKIRALAETKGVAVDERVFVCPGHFLFMHKNRPNEQDLKNAADFAKSIL